MNRGAHDPSKQKSPGSLQGRIHDGGMALTSAAKGSEASSILGFPTLGTKHPRFLSKFLRD
jgi:hypothetical protein